MLWLFPECVHSRKLAVTVEEVHAEMGKVIFPPTRKAVASSNGRPMSCKDTGSPKPVKPAGTATSVDKLAAPKASAGTSRRRRS